MTCQHGLILAYCVVNLVKQDYRDIEALLLVEFKSHNNTVIVNH